LERNVTEASDHTGYRYVFKIGDAESRQYAKLLVRNQRPFIRRSISKGVPLLAFAVLILATIAFEPYPDLTLTAIIAFAVGYFSLMVAVIWASRVLQRDLFKAAQSSRVQFECEFGDAGIMVKKGSIETRMTWDAISAVQDAEPIVALWYDATQGFLIPGRLFSDPAARAAFVTWATERVKAAAQASAAIGA
jgi:hypothetical protein